MLEEFGDGVPLSKMEDVEFAAQRLFLRGWFFKGPVAGVFEKIPRCRRAIVTLGEES